MPASTDFYYEEGAITAKFLVEVDDVEIGRFHEVSGLQVEIEMDSYIEGGQNRFVHHLPGRMSWPNVTLKRGVTKDDALLNWFHRASGEDYAGSGRVETTTMGITIVSPRGDYLRTWNFEHAIPIRWTGPTLAGEAATAPVEELEVAHHGFTVNY